MNNAKDLFNKFKEIWSNKRYHALIILLIYFIFFTVVLTSIRPSSNNNTNILKTNLEKYETMDKYKYEVNITIDDDSYYMIGYNDKFENKISIDDKIYEIKDNLYYDDSNNVFDFKNIYNIDITDFEPNKIVKYISVGNLDSETNYKNGIIKKSYLINTMNFLSIYDNNIEEIDPIDEDIIIETYEDNYVNKVVIDLSGYMKIKNVNKYILEINYSFSEWE